MGKFRSDEVVEALVAFHWDGTPTFIQAGAKLRGDDKAVQAHPKLFVRAGATDEERLAARRAASPLVVPQFQQDIDREREREAKMAIPVEERVIATTSFRAGDRFVPEGFIMRRSDPIVVADPQNFAVPARPLSTADVARETSAGV